MKIHQCAFTAPHALATEAGLSILAQGGSAIEAMVSAAAMISVVYPHMTGIGGDGFWLIDPGNASPFGIDAAGRSAGLTTGYPPHTRGGGAALTVAGTLKGWQRALASDPYRSLPFKSLLTPAIEVAFKGFPVSQSLARAMKKLSEETGPTQAFSQTFMPNGRPYDVGETFRNQAFAETLTHLATAGIDDFYQGELADTIASSLLSAGSPLRKADLELTRADVVDPLSVTIDGATLFNLPAPTQGVSSLLILALVDRLKSGIGSREDRAHLIIEATKVAFRHRDSELADPECMTEPYNRVFSPLWIDEAAKAINLHEARPWPMPADTSDTVWMGAFDRHGQMVSFIQSLYHEFGSGVGIEGAGFVWHNRGLGFDVDPSSVNAAAPFKKPRHTLNPAMAHFDDGRKLVYGTMGGDGQPQTQAAIFSRYAYEGQSLSQAISTGRWLLGRTWGDAVSDLRLEADLANEIGEALRVRGHRFQVVPARNEMMGHAGALATLDGAVIDCASDPRSDGLASVLNGRR